MKWSEPAENVCWQIEGIRRIFSHKFKLNLRVRKEKDDGKCSDARKQERTKTDREIFIRQVS
jgi:hypothetical protein